MPIGPLIFEPVLKEKVWGGRRLEKLGKSLPPGTPIGESWEIADLEQTSAGGGGGDAARSVVASGPRAGERITDLILRDRESVLGLSRSSAWGGFPLLIKFLDANANLSVQVHPSPAYAASHPGALLKTESWYIVDAEPGAVIYKGVRAGTTREAFSVAIEAGRVEALLIAVPARAGDFHHLPSGTCHALGAGIVVAEVQTPSDTTYRVYDWGRAGRALHIEASLACIEYGPCARTEASRGVEGSPVTVLERNEFYTLSERRWSADGPGHVDAHDHARVWMCVCGRGELRSGHVGEGPVSLSPGTTVLLPASMGAGEVTASEPLVVLEAIAN